MCYQDINLTPNKRIMGQPALALGALGESHQGAQPEQGCDYSQIKAMCTGNGEP